MDKRISIAEHFHSVQGEGKTVGTQAVFLRLASCNLMCGGIGTHHDGELHNGAKWRCDTIEVWKHGDKYSIEDAVALLIENYHRYLKNGSHLIITGGEPLLQSEQIVAVLEQLKYHLKVNPFVEVETNGTIAPSDNLKAMVDLFNVSPKTSNSGMKRSKRIKDKPLREFAQLSYIDQAIWKFVAFDEHDLGEIKWLLKEYKPCADEIYLMPACDDMQSWDERKVRIVELAKRNGYHFSPRLQIALWDKVTGV